MPLLNRDQILAADDLQKELVDVPEWGAGAQVYVRSLTAFERDRYVSSSLEQKGKTQSVNYKNLTAKLCTLTICDEQGKRLFTDADIDDLAKKSAVALQRCFNAASRLSGLTEADVEDIAKGVEADPFVSSPSA